MCDSLELFIEITAAVIALSGLVYAWLKDLQLKRKTYADQIRNAAGEVIAKLERRKAIMLSFYQEIQPIITDADILFTETKNTTKTRDFFWKDTIVVFNNIRLRILDEKIEVAYVSLMGYQPSIMPFYQETISQLVAIDDDMRSAALNKTQRIILNQDKDKAQSAVLGNLLRGEIFVQNGEFENRITEAISKIVAHLTALIKKDDHTIYARESDL